ncbi:hypothetical protein [Tannerella forsythia]|uniref:hypothetical protein n=1 Tax=Tannerella forsythia TaxID=28112 RepID=UPI0028EB357F|nr:hypothetical protein [Tannerella forsythia]
MNRLKEEALRRMRWRLWFAFAESKYDTFGHVDRLGRLQPDFEKITKYTMKYWGKHIKDMSEEELASRIAIVQKWK